MSAAFFSKIAAGFRKYAVLTTILTVIFAGTCCYWHLHRQPFTQNAFVMANTSTVTALVPGYITHIHVRNNQFVRKGDRLLTVYRPVYEHRLQEALSQHQAQKAASGSIEAQIRQAKARIRRFEALHANALYLAQQAMAMYSDLSVSQAYAEERLRDSQALLAQLDEEKARRDALEQELIRSRELCRQFHHKAELAKIDLEQTEVTAQNDGYVNNMMLSEGAYVPAGAVLFALVDARQWFVQANFQETELSEIRPGQKARIWLWQYPQREFSGIVESIHWGVERRLSAKDSGMPVVEKENQWLLLPQRFPVQIRITDANGSLPLHPGGSAFVRIEAPAYPLRQFFWQLFRVNIHGKTGP